LATTLRDQYYIFRIDQHLFSDFTGMMVIYSSAFWDTGLLIQWYYDLYGYLVTSIDPLNVGCEMGVES